MPLDASPPTVCLTFDNMGRAREIGKGLASLPDTNEASLAIGYPRFLDMFDELSLKGSFFIEGWNCLHHADRIREIADRGHEIGLHGWVHEEFHSLDKRTAEQLIADGKAAMELIGITPRVFRAPGGVRGPYAARIVEDFGFIGDSSVGHGYEAEISDEMGPDDLQPGLLSPRLASVPFRWKMIDVLHYRLLDRGADAPKTLEARWLAELDRLEQCGGTTTFILHPYIYDQGEERFAAVENFLRNAQQRGTIRFETVGSISARLLGRS